MAFTCQFPVWPILSEFGPETELMVMELEVLHTRANAGQAIIFAPEEDNPQLLESTALSDW